MSASFTPGIDFFVVSRVSVGVAIPLTYSHSTGIDPSNGATIENTYTGGGAELRVGVDIPCASWLSIYPRAYTSFTSESYDERSSAPTAGGFNAGAKNGYGDKVVQVGLYVPVLVHVAPHAFVGFGPTVARDLAHSIDSSNVEIPSTAFGAGLTVGGWL
jgi:hypothetical protein